MAQMLYTGPDGITRLVNVLDNGVPDFVAGSQGVARSGLPAVIPQYQTYPGGAQFLQPMQPTTQTVGPQTIGAQGSAQFKQGTKPSSQSTSYSGSSSKVNPKPTWRKGGPIPAGNPPAGPAVAESELVKKLKSLGGKAGPALLTMLADMTIGKDYQVTDSLSTPMDRLLNPMDTAYEAGRALKAEAADPRTSPAMGMVGEAAGATLQAPGRIAEGIKGIAGDVGQAVGDLFTPKGELAARDARERANAPKPVDANANSNAFLAQLGAGLTGDATSSPIDLGAAPSYEVPSLPLPGPGEKPDYTDIRNLVAQMRPEAVDTQAMENSRGMAILAGIGAGLLNFDGADAGELLLRMGMGSLAGNASIDQAKKEALSKFNDSMNEYLRTSIGVERAAMEDNLQFANRAYDTKIKQLSLNYEHAQKMAELTKPKLHEQGGKLFVERAVNGRMELQPITDSPTSRFERAKLTLQNWGFDPKLAEAVGLSMATADDPGLALPIAVVGKLKVSGQTEMLLKQIELMGDDGKQFVQKYMSMGTQLMSSPTADKTAVEKESQAARDTMLSHLLMKAPWLLSDAMDMSGMPNYIRQNYRNALESK